MKKKILVIALAVALLAMMVGGTLAYFTAEDEATNTFTVGSVRIEVNENGEATDEDTMEFGSLTPVVNTDDPSQDISYIDKVVDVSNIGNNAAYIRTYIAYPAQLEGYLILDMDTTGWTQKNLSMELDGVEYILYAFDYNTAVGSGETTTDLLKGVYLSSDVDLLENEDGDYEFIRRIGDYVDESGFVAHTLNDDGSYTSTVINVLVASQAIQAQGFENVTPSEALNSGFPTHPWSN